MPSLEEAASELYALEPGQFMGERTRLTGEARESGDTATAKAIGELRRPTTSAWLVNQLVRGEDDSEAGMERLEQLGEELREAQGALDAPRMRELTKERHQVVAGLVRQADDVSAAAGQKVSAAVRRELEDTLGAAVADEQASLAVMSGRLTRALTYAGFGEVDVSEATATPLSAVHPYRGTKRTGKESTAKPSPAQPSTHRSPAPPKHSAEEARAEKLAARRAEAVELLEQARAELTDAEQTRREREQELDEATTDQAGLQTRLDELQAEVLAVRRRLDAGDRRVSGAQRDLQRHERQLKDLTKARDRAEAALARLDQT